MDVQSQNFLKVVAMVCLSVLAEFVDTLRLRSFVGEHVIKGLHPSYTPQHQGVRRKMYAGSSGE